MYLSSTEMVRRNSRPSPLSKTSCSGCSTVSGPEPCWVQSVVSSGRLMVVPAGGSQPHWAYRGCGLPGGASSTIGGDFGSTVSRYWVSERSSMRPPLSAIEPDRRGVWTDTRGDCASASPRVSCLAGSTGRPGAGGVPDPGVPGAGVPDPGVPDPRLPRAVVTGGFLGANRFGCGFPNQITTTLM